MNENIKEWVATHGGELEENYDFNLACITKGDYFYAESSRGLDDYTLYYFDLDTQALYYFHNNI